MNFLKRYKYEMLIFLFFFFTRIPNLGYDTFNTDVWKWKTRSYDFGSGVFTLNFGKTYQKYHPGVTLMWLGAFGIKVFNLLNETVINPSLDSSNITYIFTLHFVQKLFVILAIGVSLVFIFKALKHLFGLEYAGVTLFLIILEPFYIGLTKVFHLEGLLSTFMLASVVWFYVYLQKAHNVSGKGKSLPLLVSSFFGGLSFLTKTSSLYLVPFIFLATFLWFSRDGKLSIKAVYKTFSLGFRWVLMSILVFFALWPALWVNASEVFQNLYRGIAVIGVERDHEQVYFGRYVDDPGMSFYIVSLLFRSSIYLIIGLVGYIAIRKKFLDSSKRYFALYMFLYAFFYLVQHTIPSKKLDRYILPALIGLLPIASFFYITLIKKVYLAKYNKYVFFVLIPLFTFFYVHPNYLSYYNPLFGGLRTGVRVLEPKWMFGQKEIIRFFECISAKKNLNLSSDCNSFECVIGSDQTENVLSVGFPEKYYTQIYPFFRNIGGFAVISDLTPFAKHARFFVYPVWDDTSSLEDRFDLHYIGGIKVRGVKVYSVYESYKKS